MRNVGTSKQQEILKCFDATKTYAAFAICANKDQLSDSEYKIANCADEYMRTRVGGEFLTCVANGQLKTDQARIFECAVRNQGNYRAMGICAASGQLTDEQRRVFACVANNLNDYATAGLCAAGNQLTPEQTRIATCVLQNRGNYAQMGVCAVGDQLTPEQQVFVSCAISTGGQPYAFAVCVGTQLTVNELEKCMTEGFGGSGCFGVGSGNEMVKAREAILGDDNGTLSNIIRDPVRCLTFQRDC
jgi:hypothetical protein